MLRNMKINVAPSHSDPRLRIDEKVLFIFLLPFSSLWGIRRVSVIWVEANTEKESRESCNTNTHKRPVHMPAEAIKAVFVVLIQGYSNVSVSVWNFYSLFAFSFAFFPCCLQFFFTAQRWRQFMGNRKQKLRNSGCFLHEKKSSVPITHSLIVWNFFFAVSRQGGFFLRGFSRRVRQASRSTWRRCSRVNGTFLLINRCGSRAGKFSVTWYYVGRFFS